MDTMILWSYMFLGIFLAVNAQNIPPSLEDQRIPFQPIILNVTLKADMEKEKRNEVYVPDLSPAELAEDDDRSATNENMKLVSGAMERMTESLDALRTQVTNLKYQNYLMYRQMKKIGSKCAEKGDTHRGRHHPAEYRSRKLTTAECPKDFVWNVQTKACYYFANDRVTWRMAREKCLAKDADLVAIESSREQRYLNNVARNNKELEHCDFWTGASNANRDKQWRWVGTQKPMTYQHWNHNEPNNGNGKEHCMHMMWVFNWQWNDAVCNYGGACYICEKSLKL